jgi:hypothetical protein
MRGTTFARWASPAAAALAFCSPALAQQAPGPSGPPGAETQPFGVRVSLAEAYDDNVSRSSSGLAGQRGLHQSDEIFSPNLLLDLQRTFGRETGYLSGAVGYDIYAQNSILNRERINLAGGVNTQAGLCTGGFSGGVGRFQSSLSDLTEVQQNNTIIQRGVVKNVQDTDNYGLTLSCGHPVGVSPFVSVSQSDTHNENSLLRTADHGTLSVNGGLTYQRPSIGAISLFGEYDKTTYQHQQVAEVVSLQPLAFRVLTNTYSTTSGGLRYSRAIGARLQGQLMVAYTSVSSDLSSGASFSGVTYSVDLTYLVSSKLHAHVNLVHSAKPSNFINSSLSVSDNYQLDANYALGSRTKLDLGYDWGQQHLQGQLLNPAIDLTDERTNRVFGGVQVAVFRRVTLGLDAQYEHRTANISMYGYSDARVSLSAVTQF